eukprot:XP_001707675.1 Hypothetical protein GL50803_10362 [Giardia lamblia ATCC 50803]
MYCKEKRKPNKTPMLILLQEKCFVLKTKNPMDALSKR